MADITTRSGKGSALSHTEVDANFTNLNNDKYESGDDASFSSLAVDGDTLYVDKTNNRVGINTDTPTEELEIVSGSPGVRLRDSGDNSYGRITYNAGDLFIIADDQNQISGSKLIFQVDGVEVTEIDENGNIATGAGNGDGYGITFNSGSYDASTTLDWYEQGTLSPQSQTSGTGVTTVGTGDYTRIGNVVTCYLRINNIAVGASASNEEISISGFPFSSIRSFYVPITLTQTTAASNVTSCYMHCSDWGAGLTGTLYVMVNGTLRFATVADIVGGSTDFEVQFSYFSS